MRNTENNTCTVKALANLTSIRFKVAHRLLRNQGRKNNQAIEPAKLVDAIKALGHAVTRVSKTDTDGRYLVVYHGHVASMVSGRLFEGCDVRPILSIWKVTKES